MAVGVPSLGHIDQKMIEFKVCKENRQGRDLFLLVRSVVRKCGDLHSMNKKLQFGRTTSLFIYVIIAKWNQKMEVSLDPTGTTRSDPTTLFECYLAAVKDSFPNIKALLRIGCTLPVGSADAERSFSCMSAATKDLFKQQNWVRIVYPT